MEVPAEDGEEAAEVDEEEAADDLVGPVAVQVVVVVDVDALEEADPEDPESLLMIRSQH